MRDVEAHLYLFNLGTLATLAIVVGLDAMMLTSLCMLWVRVEGRTEEEIRAEQA